MPLYMSLPCLAIQATLQYRSEQLGDEIGRKWPAIEEYQGLV